MDLAPGRFARDSSQESKGRTTRDQACPAKDPKGVKRRS